MKYPYINKVACRRFMLEYARKNRTHKFTRVHDETLGVINSLVRAHMISHVQRSPSMGKTL